MRIHSRERGQGATEYILILALAIVVILGLMYIFRDTIGGTTSQITDAVSGKTAQAAVPAGDRATESDSSQQGGSDPDGGESGGEETSKEKSTKEKADEEPEDEQAKVETTEDRASSSVGVVDDAPRTGSHGVMIIVLVVIAGVLVLIVLYFLSAASR